MDDKNEFQFGRDLIQIEDGEYEFEYHSHITNLYKGRTPKLILCVKVISQDRYYGTLLPRYYNVARIEKGRELNGVFTPKGPKSDFVREYTSICGDLPNFKSETLETLKGIKFMGLVKTVKKGENGLELNPKLCYSVVKYLYFSNK